MRRSNRSDSVARHHVAANGSRSAKAAGSSASVIAATSTRSRWYSSTQSDTVSWKWRTRISWSPRGNSREHPGIQRLLRALERARVLQRELLEHDRRDLVLHALAHVVAGWK